MPLLQNQSQNNTNNLSLITWISFGAFLALVAYFYIFVPTANTDGQSSFHWLWLNWSAQQDYEHGWMVPVLTLYMLLQTCREGKPLGTSAGLSMGGLLLIIPGALLALLAVRTCQARVALAGLPLLLAGGVWYFMGKQLAWRCAFPLFFLWMAVPVPGFQQATVWMQIIAAKMAHYGAALCGVATVLEGTTVSAADGSWDTFNIAGGCSGMRSLMALVMISFAWGYLANGLALWKRATLALSAIPLAILANAFRVCSIFVCAAYVNPAFASKTWHDWSGLLFFFPASLVGLTLLHGLLAGEIPFLHKRRVVTRRHNAPAPATPPAPAEEGKEVEP